VSYKTIIDLFHWFMLHLIIIRLAKYYSVDYFAYPDAGT
jgi:cytochrome b561